MNFEFAELFGYNWVFTRTRLAQEPISYFHHRFRWQRLPCKFFVIC
jgi:hypothetical protein